MLLKYLEREAPGDEPTRHFKTLCVALWYPASGVCMILSERLKRAIGAAVLIAAMAGSLLAQTPLSPQEKMVRLRIAGDQRLLVQKVVKSACFVMADVNAQTNAEDALEAVTAFERNARVLRQGGDTPALGPEVHDEILQHLTALDEIWYSFGPAARQVMSGDLHSVPVQQLTSLNPTALDEVDAMIVQMGERYPAATFSAEQIASTMTLAVRQSMLVQKAVKELCFYALDVNAAQMQAGLAQSIAEFEEGMVAMELGDFDRGIIDPPGLAAIRQVMDMKETWDQLRPLLDTALSGQPVSRADLETASDRAMALHLLTEGMIELYLQ